MIHVKTEIGEMAWCGTTIGNEFHFKNAELAALSGLHDPKSGVCASCLHEISAALENLKDKEANYDEKKSETPSS